MPTNRPAKIGANGRRSYSPKSREKRMHATASVPRETHSVVVGYLCWLVGFFGAHRFYYGKQVTGTVWFFTLGLLFVGWLIDLLLIPGMNAQAERRYKAGPVDYTVAWLLLAFLGLFG